MATRLANLDYSVLQQCMHCGMCLPTCPTYDETKRERHSPRGRIALMRAIADGELTVNPSFAAEMSYCLGCLACQTACPAGVHYAELFETARADIEGSGIQNTTERMFWRTVTLRWLFMNPCLLRFAGKILRLYQQSGMQTLVRKVGLIHLLPRNLQRLEPQTPAVAPQFSNQLIAEHEAPANPPRYKVALLTGCVQDLVFSSINRDTADVLLANDCAVDTPASQPCCGSLHGHNGEPGLAQQLAKRMIRLLPPQEYDAIITNAGGCGSHLKHYGNLLHEDLEYAETAKLWDTKVKDIHEWLAEIGCKAPVTGPYDTPVTLTYHDSCHLAHGQQVTKQPRQLLSLLPEVKIHVLPESNWCCGSAGVYSITQPDQAEKLLKRKVSHIQSTHAVVLATANPGCHLQIAKGLKDAHQNVEVVHPVTLLAKAYRREKEAAKHNKT